MIPKILHYCWFGGKKKPRLAQKCMESWRRFAPDFLLVEWNEQNFAIESVPFVRQAYEDKKYAYVSDYVRGHALAGQGGVYLDTDMELLRPLDAFLRDDLFAGVEPGNFVACGIIGSAAGHPLWAEYLARYRQSTYDRAHPVTNVPL
ncbi:MAG: mannosyltransferase, partial [Oscillospiraceae bacterium]|nr:mannosyltransferase [Oscillospiraceae bacterium]